MLIFQLIVNTINMKNKLILSLLTLFISVSIFSQKTIVSINKIGQAKDGSLCYVSREIVKFVQSNDVEVMALVEEKLFLIEPVLDSLGVDTGITQMVIKEKKGKTLTKFENSLVDFLFTSIGEDIQSTDSFMDKFNLLLQKALLLYTQQINRYGTTDWELYIE